jgi:hypothetical protein
MCGVEVIRRNGGVLSFKPLLQAACSSVLARIFGYRRNPAAVAPIGDELSVDVDLEAKDQVWSSRQHAVITWGDGVNRSRIKPGEKVPLKENDVLRLGMVQLKAAPAR